MSEQGTQMAAARLPVYIYALVDPRDESVRYIGRTTNPEGRLANHCQREPSSPKKDAWVMELRAARLRPQMRILHVVGHSEADRMERLTLAQHLAMGCALTNTMTGLPAKVPEQERMMAVGGNVSATVYNAMVEVAWTEGLSLGDALSRLVGEALAARAAAMPVAPAPEQEETA